jgi:AraC-like DNA-binding protein
MDLIRAAGLRGLTDLVDDLGGDGRALLRRFDIGPEQLESDNDLIPALTGGRVLEAAAAELRVPDLGLRLARRQDARVLGPLAVAIENSPTVGDALDVASRFLFVHSPVLRIAQGEDPERVRGVVGVHYGETAVRPVGAPQAIDLGVGVIHQWLSLVRADYGLRGIHLPHRPLAAPQVYEEFFAAPVRFDQPEAVLRIPASLLSSPLENSDEVVRRIALDYLATHFTDPSQSLTARTRTLVAQSLGSTEVRVEAVARWLGLHPRTLQRHLATEGTTFETVVDDARRDAVHRLLTRSDLPMSQITRMVGLSEQSALTRASRRWFGVPPSRLRVSQKGK